MKAEMTRQFFTKFGNVTFHENPSAIFKLFYVHKQADKWAEPVPKKICHNKG
jgi:hypothetical protein